MLYCNTNLPFSNVTFSEGSTNTASPAVTPQTFSQSSSFASVGMSGGGTISLSPALAGSAGIIPTRNTGGKLIENGNILLNEGLSSFTPLHLASSDKSSNSSKVTSNLGNEIDITPSSNHTTTTKNPGLKGTPNSSIVIVDSNGNIKTRRWFGPDGTQMRDVDFTNHGNAKLHPEWPHVHGPR